MDFFKDILDKKKGTYISSNAFLLCENAHHHQIYKKEKVSNLESNIRKINIVISATGRQFNQSSKARSKAFAQILLILPQCPKEMMTSHGEKWFRLSLQSLKSKDVVQIQAILLIVNYVLSACEENKELHKAILKSDSQLITSLCALDIEHIQDGCKCLYAYLRLFPLQSLQYKNQLEKYVMHSLTLPLTDNSDDVTSSARVFAALPLPGASGNIHSAKGAQLDRLVCLCHCAMDAIFSNVQENEDYSFSREHNLPLTTLAAACDLKQPIRMMVTAVPILSNTLVFIQEFLSSATSDFVSIRPRDLIMIAFRILQVEANMLKRFVCTESTALGFLLPSLHLRALKYLKYLISNNVCGLFMNLVEEQIVAVLKSTLGSATSEKSSSKGNSEDKETGSMVISSIKRMCYECLTELIKVSSGCQVACIEGLLPVLVSDIQPIKEKLLMRAATRGSRLSQVTATKKSKKKGYTVKEVESNTGTVDEGRTGSAHHSVPTVVAALNYVEALFLYAYHSLDLRYVRTLYKHITSLTAQRVMGVFDTTEVKVGVLRALGAYAMYPHPLCPPNYSWLFQVFFQGSKDCQSEISSLCDRNLATISFAMANPSVLDLSDALRLNKQKDKESEDLDDDIANTFINSKKRRKRYTATDAAATTTTDNSINDNSNMESEHKESLSSDNENDDEKIPIEEKIDADNDDDEVHDSDNNDDLRDNDELENNENLEESKNDTKEAEIDNESDSDLDSSDDDHENDETSLSKGDIPQLSNSTDDVDNEIKVNGRNSTIETSNETESLSPMEEVPRPSPKVNGSPVEKSEKVPKRKCSSKEPEPTNAKKPKTAEEEFPSIAEMLESFVDADPDSD